MATEFLHRLLNQVQRLGKVALIMVLSSLFTLLVLRLSGNLSLTTSAPAARPPLEVSELSQSARGGELIAATFREQEDENAVIATYQYTNEAVVNITAESTDLVYNWFFQPVPRKNESTGSGSIFDARGYVITNSHVVKSADKLLITLFDGQQYAAELLGIDYETDLAILKFEPGKRTLTTIKFGDSGYIKVGQTVLAIGNPYGLERTLTKGIISGLGRPIENESGVVVRDMIQTDASINPGNSGGPLLNQQGELIGINSSIYTPSGGSVGIGFALPVNSAKRVIKELIEYGKVRRGWIDIVPIQLFPQLVRYANLDTGKGLLVSELIKDGNAATAGLRGGKSERAVRSGDKIIYLGGDIIIGLDDVPINTLADLYGALETSKPGQKVTVKYLRKNKTYSSEIVLSERPN